MTDNTSPIAKLTGGLPKGNGLSRAVPALFEQRGALVPFVGYLRIEETGLDADDVQHLRASISRFELCLGPLERDGEQLITRASTAATSRENGGQVALFADEHDRDQLRAEILAELREWSDEQTPPLTDEDLTEKWNSFHGGHYDHRLDYAVPDHLRAFGISIGAFTDPETPDVNGQTDESTDDDLETDDPQDDDEQTPALAGLNFSDSPA